MSGFESKSGKIRLVELKENETLQEQELRLWIGKGKSSEDYYVGCLRDEFYKEYAKIQNRIWEVVELKDEDLYGHFCNLTHNDDGTISFFTQYHNGGTYFEEMIEIELKKQHETRNNN